VMPCSACIAEGRRNLAYNRRMLWEKDGGEEGKRGRDVIEKRNGWKKVDSKDRDATREREREKERKSALFFVYLVVRYGTTRGKYRGRYLVPPQAGSHTFLGDNI